MNLSVPPEQNGTIQRPSGRSPKSKIRRTSPAHPLTCIPSALGPRPSTLDQLRAHLTSDFCRIPAGFLHHCCRIPAGLLHAFGRIPGGLNGLPLGDGQSQSGNSPPSARPEGPKPIHFRYPRRGWCQSRRTCGSSQSPRTYEEVLVREGYKIDTFPIQSPPGGHPSYSCPYSYSSPSTVPVPLRQPRSIREGPKPYHFQYNPPGEVVPVRLPRSIGGRPRCSCGSSRKMVPVRKDPFYSPPAL
jgi:hypothetical protein